MKRPGQALRERTLIKLINGKTVETRTLFADIVNNLRTITVFCIDEHGNRYEANNFTIDVNRVLTAHKWFQA